VFVCSCSSPPPLSFIGDGSPLLQGKSNVPLTEILATVNLHTEFATELRHLRQTHVRQVSEKILFAGVIGLGCAIGSAKMAQISTSLGTAELDSAINWRFSLENLCAANDRITSFMAAMELPNIYRRSEN